MRTDLPVRLRAQQAGRKLSPQRQEWAADGKLRQHPVAPFCAATYVSIKATCPESCKLKEAGACYVTTGITSALNRKLDRLASQRPNKRYARWTGDAVMKMERDLIMASFAYSENSREIPDHRALRLHVGGDVSSQRGAEYLAEASADWLDRGGGPVWTFTHRWEEIDRTAFGTISVLASVESVEGIRAANARGYAAAVVVSEHPSPKLYVHGGKKVIPCPAETHKTTCVECQLCLDADKLLARDVSIGFALHGRGKKKLSLPVIT